MGSLRKASDFFVSIAIAEENGTEARAPMHKIERLIGLTPVLKRLAFFYLKKGVGSHAIDHHLFDEVVVRELYDWYTPDEKKMPPQGGMVVSFLRLGQRVRWVEFGCHYTGGGGEDILREV